MVLDVAAAVCVVGAFLCLLAAGVSVATDRPLGDSLLLVGPLWAVTTTSGGVVLCDAYATARAARKYRGRHSTTEGTPE